MENILWYRLYRNLICVENKTGHKKANTAATKSDC